MGYREIHMQAPKFHYFLSPLIIGFVIASCTQSPRSFDEIEKSENYEDSSVSSAIDIESFKKVINRFVFGPSGEVTGGCPGRC